MDMLERIKLLLNKKKEPECNCSDKVVIGRPGYLVQPVEIEVKVKSEEGDE